MIRLVSTTTHRADLPPSPLSHPRVSLVRARWYTCASSPYLDPTKNHEPRATPVHPPYMNSLTSDSISI